VEARWSVNEYVEYSHGDSVDAIIKAILGHKLRVLVRDDIQDIASNLDLDWAPTLKPVTFDAGKFRRQPYVVFLPDVFADDLTPRQMAAFERQPALFLKRRVGHANRSHLAETLRWRCGQIRDERTASMALRGAVVIGSELAAIGLSQVIARALGVPEEVSETIKPFVGFIAVEVVRRRLNE